MNKAFIGESDNGFFLTNAAGLVLGNYSRRRDAVRGATRRGFVVA